MITLLLGGLGLFLLGMTLMTEGLKLAGGSSLQRILANWTSTRPKAFLTGFGATALVQSSSAVTVSVIGFVNAGLMEMSQSLWLIFGSNVGTTMTAWIVTLIGFKVKVEIFALPAIGLGTIANLFLKRPRLKAMGGAIAGFGLLFLGLQFMQEAFVGVDQRFDLMDLNNGGFLQMLSLVLVGALMTALMQSSSASIAVVLTAVATNVLSLQAGAAAVIGANIGTTVTAVIAALSATPAARRLAVAHMVFNLVAALAALVLLGVLLTVVFSVQEILRLDTNPAVSLAIFHTLFNLTGAVLMIPLEGRLKTWLGSLFVSISEQISRPQYLDSATAESPDRALKALMLEERRLLELVGNLAIQRDLGSDEALQELQSIRTLVGRINDFVASASSGSVPEEVSRGFQEVVGLNIHVDNMIENLTDLRSLDPDHLTPDLDQSVAQLTEALADLVKLAQAPVSPEQMEEFLEAFETKYQSVFDQLRHAGQFAQINMRSMESTIRYVATLRRIVRQYAKALRGLGQLSVADSAPADQ